MNQNAALIDLITGVARDVSTTLYYAYPPPRRRHPLSERGAGKSCPNNYPIRSHTSPVKCSFNDGEELVCNIGSWTN